MKYKIIIGVTFTLGIIASCKVSHYTESRKYLKQYAFCQCLQHASNDSILKADLSPFVYQDLANYDLNVYDIIDSISRIKGLSITPSIIADHGGKKQ